MFFKKKKRYFLDRIVVASKSESAGSFFGFGEGGAKETLVKIACSNIELPRLQSVSNLEPNDIGVDIVVSDYSLGGQGSIDIGDFGFFFFSRPKVKLVARTFNAMSKVTINEYTIVQNMSWSKYIKRTISIKRMFSFKPQFDNADLSIVLIGACIKLLKKIKASNS